MIRPATFCGFMRGRLAGGRTALLNSIPPCWRCYRTCAPASRAEVANTFLRPDGLDRLRDKKGKTSTGRARGAAVMLSAFDEPTMGLVICEGAETGISILMAGLAPVWALGGAGNLAALPVLGGIEALTVAADADEAGQKAAEATAERWRAAGREVAIVTPPAGDWADRR